MHTDSEKSVFTSNFEVSHSNISLLLEKCDLGKRAAGQDRILIKPNLVETLAPPITTPVSLVKAIIEYLLSYMPSSRILIGEGCGATNYDTHHAFAELGYAVLAHSYDIRLIDLNEEELCHKYKPECHRWPEMYLPKILDDVFLLSVPVLKAHSLSGVTLTMKNMMGCAPPQHYQGGGGWKKAAFHRDIQNAIFDLNRYRTPDFTVLDASIGMAEAHLWGPHCNPPVGIIAASSDPVAIDSYGTTLLKRSWQDIDHIAMAHQVLGDAEEYKKVALS